MQLPHENNALTRYTFVLQPSMTSPTLPTHSIPSAPKSSRYRRFSIPILLFLVTLLTTTAVGMRYMLNFRLGQPPLRSDDDILPYGWVFHHLHLLPTGLPFSLTLVGILLTHEFGHYFACRFFRVDATLPWMLPAPSLSGTFGAVIRLRSRVITRTALIVIGAAGPIAGFLVALGTVALGLAHSTYATEPFARVHAPLLMIAIHHLQSSDGAPSLRLIVPHPMLIASWMGLFITALNLIPAGQLDGGHIVYAISPALHRWSTRLVIAGLVVLGIFAWAGWLLWAVVLLLPGMRHPRVPDATRPTKSVLALIPICFAILLFCGTLQPFGGYSLTDILRELLERWH